MNIKATKKPKFITVTGQKDPRGPDNTIKIWIDSEGNLRIRVQKPSLRCYQYSHTEENSDAITIIQNK